MNDIDRMVQQIDKLEPVSMVTNKVLEMMEKPDVSMEELAEIISYDANLTANLLKYVNSAYTGLSRTVETVRYAVVYLGIREVLDLLMMTVASKNQKKAQNGYDLEAGDLWKASVSSALIAKELANMKGAQDSYLIFTAALLKDIGKVVLNQYVRVEFEKINTLVLERGHSFREAEKAVIGIDHAELGGIVAERWKFSPRLVEMIRNHHTPHLVKEARRDTAIVYVADTICMMMGIGGGADGLAYRFHKEIVQDLGMDEKDFQKAIAAWGEQLERVEALFEMA